MRRTLALLLLFAGLSLAACSPADPFITQTCDRIAQHQGAFLRVIHAVPSGPPVNVYIGASSLFPAPQTYLGFQVNVNEASYYPVAGGSQTITFKLGGTTLADTTVTLGTREYYTAYFYGKPGAYHVLITSDDVLNTPDSTHTKYRIVQLSPDAGAVRVDQFTDQENLIVTPRVAYGQASDYFLSKSYISNGPGIRVLDADNPSRQIYWLPQNYIFLPGTAIFTLLITGNANPMPGDTLIYFALLQENAVNGGCLRGQAPLKVEFAGVRAVNLMPTGSDDRLDFAFYDASEKYRSDEHFRRELTYSQQQILEVFNVQFRPVQPSMLLSTFLRSSYPYRVELHGHYPVGSDDFYHGYQTPYVPGANRLGLPFSARPSTWYTLVAFGPFDTTKARSVYLVDNLVPIPGKVVLRFFHGGYNAGSGAGAQDTALMLRPKAGGNATPAMSYGQVPGMTDTIAVAPGTTTFQVVDKAGNVYLEQDVALPDAGGVYTIFLHRGMNGDALRLDVEKQDYSFL